MTGKHRDETDNDTHMCCIMLSGRNSKIGEVIANLIILLQSLLFVEQINIIIGDCFRYAPDHIPMYIHD